MRLKYITVSSKGLDTPIRFPAPGQPSLRTAPDSRLTKTDEEDVLPKEAQIEDARKGVRFGGRFL